jgi:hypothetical protein
MIGHQPTASVARDVAMGLRRRALLSVVLMAMSLMVAMPPRPDCRLPFPASLDEANPAPDEHQQPRWLQAVVSNLDRIGTMTHRTGQRLVVSFFLWMIPDRMILDSQRHAQLVQHLLRFYPLRYADLRRLADYQNRVLGNWAKSRTIDFVDTAASFPYDPSLFDDAGHLNERGQRIQAWIVFQGLIPVIERMLETGVRPRAHSAKSSFEASARARRISVPVEQLAVDCEEP